MKTTIIGGPRSRLHGAICRGPCRKPVAEGDAVVYWLAPNNSYREDRVVTHIDCMRAVLDRAPAAPPVQHHVARASAIRRQVLATGDPFAPVAKAS